MPNAEPSAARPSAAHPEAVEPMSEILSGKLNEAAIRSRLDEVLRKLGRSTELEFQTGKGPADIYLPARRFVIETKTFGKADPGQRRVSGGETQFQQCNRYVLADHRRERQQLGLGFEESQPRFRREPWKAALTDGRRWWVWRWQVEPDGGLRSKPDAAEDVTFGKDQAAKAVDWLHSVTSETSGKLWIPKKQEELLELFMPFRDRLDGLYYDLSSDTPTGTKLKLWEEMLKGSGLALPKKEERRAGLFKDHTLLVTVARAVISDLADSDVDPVEVMADGFASWTQAREHDGPARQPGVEWINDLFKTVREYDWRQRGHDVLKVLYQGIIPKETRKAFGEYYTPDWLAEAVVKDLLDEDWLEHSAGSKADGVRGVGVLDPACGSGTFLFHAARRILCSEAVRRRHLSPVRRADLAAGLVSGIDIHPVAVEMSRATLLRALPANPTDGAAALRVFQGDSLLWNSQIKIGAEDEDGPATLGQGRWFEDDAGNFEIATPSNQRCAFQSVSRPGASSPSL